MSLIYVTGVRVPDELYFYCPNRCGKKYKHRGSLYKHMKYECGVDSQFRCTDCSKSFSQKVSLKTHMGLIHNKFL